MFTLNYKTFNYSQNVVIVVLLYLQTVQITRILLKYFYLLVLYFRYHLKNHFRFSLTTNSLLTLPVYFTNIYIAWKKAVEFGVTNRVLNDI